MGRPRDAEDNEIVGAAEAEEGRSREAPAEPEQVSKTDDEDGEEEEEGEDEENADRFFETLDRVPSGVSFELDLHSSASDSDDDEEDLRLSFASAVDAPRFSVCIADLDDCFDDDVSGTGGFDYGIWMAEPISLSERRRRFLQGMGLASRRDLATSVSGFEAISRRETRSRLAATSRARLASHRFPPPLPPSAGSAAFAAAVPGNGDQSAEQFSILPPAQPSSTFVLTRCRSDPHVNLPSFSSSLAAFGRSSSAPPSPWLRHGACKRSETLGVNFEQENGQTAEVTGGTLYSGDGSGGVAGGVFRIKNLDTGKEFMVSEVGKDGSFGQLNDVQTGVQLSTEEFERFIGFSPIVKELMRRVNLKGGSDEKNSSSNSGGKTSKSGRRKRRGWLKNIKFVASSVTGFISEKERENSSSSISPAGGAKSSSSIRNSSDWLKVHQHGKSYKELTGLYMCQEIQAHQGSIWCMKFSSDGRYLASAGEDRTVHVWQVTESDTFSSFSYLRRQDSRLSGVFSSPVINGFSSSRMDQVAILDGHPSKRTKKASKLGGSRSRSLPDYIVLPEAVFSLSEKPVCSFEGHLDDVLDLSWSRSQHLLSSSMDKTVRLWDMESKACLKLFAHNDYVTCIQFNPIDDNYFISGSLDAKVRIWSIPDRQVVDWSDLHEMVTAVCYSPDGQGALVGSHKGSFRLYSISDNKLAQENQIDIRNKKKKSHAKKITGFQYAPDNSSEVMVTSADSQIRLCHGVDIIRKFRGFRNTSSQISASFTDDGKYIVCASEDSHVYIWKRDAAAAQGTNASKSKSLITTRSHEYFYCKDVSVAIPWPNSGSNHCEKPALPPSSSISSLNRHGASNRSNLSSSSSSSNLDDPFPPPLPPKKALPEQLTPLISDELRAGGTSSPPRLMRSSVNSSSSSFASWGWGGGSSSRVAASAPASGPESSNAWGLVVVTAGLNGEIRVYQNFGLPIRLSRQTNLFL
ncbi:U4/U6 small nuclear ribonucleoprotein PRP4-like protein [Apostasia shenzhenica]|uniref:U4/U6 small nuclear ribonucleoprotein PRP4-like protein n=1 Tax=Apostasia shenzhenica TaxID=1088818 RepID=A0A2I0AYJ6_9ASPA|nr:U4/U6 small nuclear ribonucleoprotein PRP4-like protein [Apostasia shenzhenica]